MCDGKGGGVAVKGHWVELSQGEPESMPPRRWSGDDGVGVCLCTLCVGGPDLLPLKNKKVLIEIYCIKKCLLDLDPI